MNYIFTDGAAKANGKTNCKSAWAFYVYNNKYSESQLLECAHSNNRAELTAIYRALQYIKNQPDNISYTIVSDSEYSIKCITLWVKNWIANPTAGINKKNKDIIYPAYELLVELSAHNNIEFKHIKSHTKAPKADDPSYFMWEGNMIVDKLCTRLLH